MKKYISFMLAFCMGMTCLSGCGKKTEKNYRILFVGNSFTEFHNMPQEIFAPLCEMAGINVTVDAVTRGSYILENFANPADFYGAKVDKCLRENKYDFVVLQEQSSRPISDKESFKRGVRRLAEKVKENGAELFLYETWGYKEGHGSLHSFGSSTHDMAKKLSESYMEAAKEVDAKIIHAGIAMLDVYVNHKDEIELYMSDYHHSSQTGSTLVAYTMLCTIFGVDVRNVDYSSGSKWRDKILKQAAYEATMHKNM